MQAALYDERDGYYCRPGRVRWGRAGDYRTAPERSPLFAATFARYFMKLFVELGSPERWSIIEAGAGAGDFAYGVLSSLQSNFPDVFAVTHYLIDEISPDARAQARAKLERIRVAATCIGVHGFIFRIALSPSMIRLLHRRWAHDPARLHLRFRGRPTISSCCCCPSASVPAADSGGMSRPNEPPTSPRRCRTRPASRRNPSARPSMRLSSTVSVGTSEVCW